MQILLNADRQIGDHAGLSSYLEAVASEMLGRYGGRLIRIDAHLSDANSAAKADTDDIHCMLEAQVTGLEPIVAKQRSATPRQAIHEAVGKLERAIAHAIGKHEARRTQTSEDDTTSV